ncbi:MAG TPA: leucyl aminopeptidase [Caulobacteraceae bacterium]|nr:leucyl aminopeptidase [Caulobacteraceae bacterium]
MDVEFVSIADAEGDAGAWVAAVLEGGALTAGAQRLNGATDGAVERAIAAAAFTGARGKVLELIAPPGVPAARILLVGAGPQGDVGPGVVELVAAEAYRALKTSGAATMTLALDGAPPPLAAATALGVRLAAYRFDRYRTQEKADAKPSIRTARVAVADVEAARAAFAPLAALADGVTFTRDLVSEPANILYPAEFARRVKALESMGLDVEILGEAEMTKLGMGALLGVGQGSERESQLAVIQWKGGGDTPPLAFIGKGVCFDTGGISLKPADGMEEMKWDMGGAGAVAGLMHTLAARKAKVNAVGILGLVENMPDGNAQRPGDIVTSMSGQTVEVINTDAEGRLVLADALWYVQQRFKPRLMVDLATLTGAIIISLGHDLAGLFCNNDVLADQLLAAGKASRDELWRLPLPEAYEKQLESLAADFKNIGGRPAGSITAALFLQKFVRDTPWAHLDIAAVAWRKPSTIATIPEGASGFGVRLLNQFVADNYES